MLSCEKCSNIIRVRIISYGTDSHSIYCRSSRLKDFGSDSMESKPGKSVHRSVSHNFFLLAISFQLLTAVTITSIIFENNLWSNGVNRINLKEIIVILFDEIYCSLFRGTKDTVFCIAFENKIYFSVSFLNTGNNGKEFSSKKYLFFQFIEKFNQFTKCMQQLVHIFIIMWEKQ